MDIQSIKAKIKALFAKTVEAGCSEEEALAAAQKAEQMLQKYQIENLDLMFDTEEVGKTRYNTTSKQMPAIVSLTCVAIAGYTNCKVWLQGPEVIFFGLETDRQLAYYMQDMIRNICESEYRRFKMRQGPTTTHGRTSRGSFEKGFAVRVAQRLVEMKKQADASRMTESNSKALIVNKDALIKREFDKLGMKLGSGKTQRYTVKSSGAYGAGQAAGDRANLARGVGSRQKCAGLIAG